MGTFSFHSHTWSGAGMQILYLSLRAVIPSGPMGQIHFKKLFYNVNANEYKNSCFLVFSLLLQHKLINVIAKLSATIVWCFFLIFSYFKVLIEAYLCSNIPAILQTNHNRRTIFKELRDDDTQLHYPVKL